MSRGTRKSAQNSAELADRCASSVKLLLARALGAFPNFSSLARGRRSRGGSGCPRYLDAGLVHIRAAKPLDAWVKSEPVEFF